MAIPSKNSSSKHTTAPSSKSRSGSSSSTKSSPSRSSPSSPTKSTATKSAAARAAKKKKTEDDFRWEELQRIEKRRRAILPRVEETWYRQLLFWDGTVLEILAFDFLFWFTVAVYITIGVLVYVGVLSKAFGTSLGSNNLTVVGGFLSFFLVFFVNQNNSRYFQNYKDAMACKGRIFDTALLAATNLPREQALRLVRYMNASHAAGFVGLSDTYSNGNLFRPLNEQLCLLTEDELERMNEIDLDAGGGANRELINWCMMEVQRAVNNKLIDSELARDFRDQILRLRSGMGALFDSADLPVPFFYVHFITLMTSLYLPLFAVSYAFNSGGDVAAFLIGLLVVIFQSTFVIGLRILGQKISDPFGDDLIDLSVIFYVNFCWINSNRLLAAEYPGPASVAEEERIILSRKSIGGAWDRVARDPETGRMHKHHSLSLDVVDESVEHAAHDSSGPRNGTLESESESPGVGLNHVPSRMRM